MLEELKYLLQLQEIDGRIKEQELAQENFPLMVQELKEEIIKATETRDALKKKVLTEEEERHNWEEQVETAKSGLERSQERLNSIRTNREYDAVHAEIEAQKNIINSAEQRRNNISAEIENLRNMVHDHDEALQKIIAENEPKIKELQEKISAIDSTIATIEKERDVIVPHIGKLVLRQYELIRSRRKTGKAISIISGNRTCSICFKVLEPQLFNEIKRGTKVILCQSCGSIMIWQESTDTISP